jgi:hypothetical protein
MSGPTFLGAALGSAVGVGVAGATVGDGVTADSEGVPADDSGLARCAGLGSGLALHATRITPRIATSVARRPAMPSSRPYPDRMWRDRGEPPLQRAGTTAFRMAVRR